MGAMKVYDPDQVQCSFGGILIKGYADDSMISIEYAEDAFLKKAGADGEVVRSKNANRMATVTIHLMQTSDTNVEFDAIHEKDMLAPAGAGIGSFQVQDLQGNTLLQAEHAWIEAPPNPEFGKEAGPREWKIACAELKGTHGGN